MLREKGRLWCWKYIIGVRGVVHWILSFSTAVCITEDRCIDEKGWIRIRNFRKKEIK